MLQITVINIFLKLKKKIIKLLWWTQNGNPQWGMLSYNPPEDKKNLWLASNQQNMERWWSVTLLCCIIWDWANRLKWEGHLQALKKPSAKERKPCSKKLEAIPRIWGNSLPVRKTLGSSVTLLHRNSSNILNEFGSRFSHSWASIWQHRSAPSLQPCEILSRGPREVVSRFLPPRNHKIIVNFYCSIVALQC